ncbi:hypothetical protein B0A49_04992 [Cryomyces minteri]|uniref:Uncharacterized protein n=1 Tax=Cryomyces minteri TaxID=331657 RepID=A0A4U0X726_9PEZI|nr:hypothetical protein B0A49_04992 [Cryomyces minteri]
MPPATKPKSADKDIVYASEPPLKQKKFNPRRRVAKPLGHIKPEAPKRQSTLTQIDFAQLTPREGFDLDTHSGDEEWELPGRRKRRRTASRDRKRQSTLTQIDFGTRVAPSSDEGEFDLDERVQNEDVDTKRGWHVEKGGDVEFVNQGQKPTVAARDQFAGYITAERGDSEVVSCAGPTTARESACLRIVEDSRAPADAGTINPFDPRTPRKIRVLEVPSSQSPPDAPLSTQSLRSYYANARSPLHQKSVNILPTQKSPSKAQWLASDLSPSPHKIPSCQDILDMETSVSSAPKPAQLKHQHTIQDSDDEKELSPLKLRHQYTIQDSDEEILEDSNSRVNEMEYSYAVMHTQGSPDDFEILGTDFGYSYNPVNSALSRDEARYLLEVQRKRSPDMGSPTLPGRRAETGQNTSKDSEQHCPTSQLNLQGKDARESKSEFYDAMSAIVPAPPQASENPPANLPIHIRSDSEEASEQLHHDLLRFTQRHPTQTQPQSSSQPASTTPEQTHHSSPPAPDDDHDKPVLSSQPDHDFSYHSATTRVRPSQASTVDITQINTSSSSRRAQPRHHHHHRHQQQYLLSSSSPHKLRSSSITVPSSPLLSSPVVAACSHKSQSAPRRRKAEHRREREGERDAEPALTLTSSQLLPDSLLDFSLPLPPPLTDDEE